MSGVKIGDRVRVREWGDLLHEYGYVYRGGVLIDAPYKLSEEYKFVCGEEATVEDIVYRKNSRNYECVLTSWTVDLKNAPVHFVAEMLEVVEPYIFDAELFAKMLGTKLEVQYDLS